jgi:hypothetical protein
MCVKHGEAWLTLVCWCGCRCRPSLEREQPTCAWRGCAGGQACGPSGRWVGAVSWWGVCWACIGRSAASVSRVMTPSEWCPCTAPSSEEWGSLVALGIVGLRRGGRSWRSAGPTTAAGAGSCFVKSRCASFGRPAAEASTTGHSSPRRARTHSSHAGGYAAVGGAALAVGLVLPWGVGLGVN